MNFSRLHISEAGSHVLEGVAHESRKTFMHVIVWIRESHTDLSHTVSLEQGVARDLLPALMNFLGEGRGSTDHCPDLTELGQDFFLARLEAVLVIVVNHPQVDRRHCHEDGEVYAILVVEQHVPDGALVELGDEGALGTAPQAGVQHVDDAVHVVEGKHITNMVALVPLPLILHLVEHGLEGPVSMHHALGVAGGARRVDDHGILLELGGLHVAAQ
mmetsp:Transcript_31745/g.48673  ORF Transcript_31745/g.48673 Transcript_31745/m.48673 type:complete len:216 (-) Transcript_31745:457-1104(-)|eukprot:CAMPEP_0170495430 /NCGR_PEP_ID=MMETSP0208-20121228/16017_1 /TAXON_ID=197538 /ORGANISM="Strombidium inclinatum, Strain S3" /LENGTH=215 /DNA_ID=CAMNT_0010771651 /DNA_START=409 /DNA_END=1056 /DNA_ORIENTATION=+